MVIDADEIVRLEQRPGTPTFRAIVETFGERVVAPDGTLDRTALAQLVFTDDDARAALNAIVHPVVMAEIAARTEALSGSGVVAVLDVPLLVEVGGGEGLDVRIAVEAPEEIRVARLRTERGMDASEVHARIAAQATDAQRRRLADVVIVNDRDEDALRARVDEVWLDLLTRARRGEGAPAEGGSR